MIHSQPHFVKKVLQDSDDGGMSRKCLLSEPEYMLLYQGSLSWQIRWAAFSLTYRFQSLGVSSFGLFHDRIYEIWLVGRKCILHVHSFVFVWLFVTLFICPCVHVCAWMVWLVWGVRGGCQLFSLAPCFSALALTAMGLLVAGEQISLGKIPVVGNIA